LADKLPDLRKAVYPSISLLERSAGMSTERQIPLFQEDGLRANPQFYQKANDYFFLY
jgi:hypothetical protein